MIGTGNAARAAFAVGAILAAVTMIGSSVAMPMESCPNGNQGWEASASRRGSAVAIEVRGDNWGGGRPQDIKVLLDNVASHMTRHLREDFSPVIEVRHWSRGHPRILYRLPGRAAYTVMLSATGRLWAKYSYQFAHEFCHLLSDYERLAGSANAWFHESICEVASLFTLRAMAVTWETDAPYPNWTGYAGSLRDYADQTVGTVKDRIHNDREVGSWLRRHEADGRMDPYIRERNLIVALRILPLFERHHDGWNALRRLPASNAPIDQYLAQWKEEAYPCDRGFVDQIEETLGTRSPAHAD